MKQFKFQQDSNNIKIQAQFENAKENRDFNQFKFCKRIKQPNDV